MENTEIVCNRQTSIPQEHNIVTISPLDFLYSMNIQQEKKFIAIHNSFDKQFEKLRGYYDGINEQDIRRSLSSISDSLLDIHPDKISLQLTYDQSLFYIMFKGSKTIYYELFLDKEKSQNEVIVTVFEEDINTQNVSGTEDSTIEYLYEILPKRN